MILVYCVAPLEKLQIPENLKVVQGDQVQCLYEQRAQMPHETSLQAEAVRFFETNQKVFAQIDILEFRFPTWLNDEAELRTFLAHNEEQLARELARLKGLAQLTVYLPDQKGAAAASATPTGTEYLQSKRDRIREYEGLVREILNLDQIQDSLVQGNRLLLLLARETAAATSQRLKQRERIRVAGPFPPSAFAKLVS